MRDPQYPEFRLHPKLHIPLQLYEYDILDFESLRVLYNATMKLYLDLEQRDAK